MKYGDVVIYTCACGAQKRQKYRKCRWENWSCQKCGINKARNEGKLGKSGRKYTDEERSIISKRSKDKWKDIEYRSKMLVRIRYNANKKKLPTHLILICDGCGKKRKISRRYAQCSNVRKRCPSCAMCLRWQNDEYKNHVSSIVSINNKIKWQNQEYRSAVTSSNSITWSNRRAELSKRALKLWQDPEYRNKAVECWQDPIYREKMAVVRSSQSGKLSHIQGLLYHLLDNLGVDYYREGSQTRIGYYVFDCLVRVIDRPDILIECQGDYWHTLYKAQKNDRSKFTYIKRYFPEYEIMYVWEHEFYTKGRVLDRLKLKLGTEVLTVDFEFDDIEIRTPNSRQLKSFLDSYHYIGKGRGGVVFGAYYNEELVACCVFSSPLRQNTAQYFGETDKSLRELSRFCIHPSYHKKNFASWFISKCLKLIECSKIIAYADKTVGHIGTIYKASNFEYHHTVNPDYWYVDEDGYVMHKKTLYGKARKMKMTEAEFAQDKGYTKRWGGEKLCYVFNGDAAACVV